MLRPCLNSQMVSGREGYRYSGNSVTSKTRLGDRPNRGHPSACFDTRGSHRLKEITKASKIAQFATIYVSWKGTKH